MDATTTPMNEVFALVGGVGALASKLGLKGYQTVQQWRGRPPIKYVPVIEYLCDGRVTAEQLRPDVTWQRKRIGSWPHPKGAPLADFTAIPA